MIDKKKRHGAWLAVGRGGGTMGHKRNMRLWYAVAALVIIIVAVYLLLGMGGSTVLVSGSNVSLKNGSSTSFRLAGGGPTYSLYLVSATNSSATFYLGKVPILASPVMQFTLSKGGAVNASADGSYIADVEVRLLASTQGQASLALNPIPASLGVAQSVGVTSFNPLPTGQGGGSAGSQGAATTTAVTTVVTTATGMTTAATTTVAQSASVQAMAKVNSTTYGSLMNSYNKLYMEDAACTPGVYNITLTAYTHPSQQPVGPESYWNVTPFVPSMILSNATLVSGTIWDVTYTAVTPTGRSQILDLKVDISSGTVLSATFEGLFAGLNYTVINNNYIFQSSVGNACAAYIP